MASTHTLEFDKQAHPALKTIVGHMNKLLPEGECVYLSDVQGQKMRVVVGDVTWDRLCALPKEKFNERMVVYRNVPAGHRLANKFTGKTYRVSKKLECEQHLYWPARQMHFVVGIPDDPKADSAVAGYGSEEAMCALNAVMCEK
jgi:hypothetical protein